MKPNLGHESPTGYCAHVTTKACVPFVSFENGSEENNENVKSFKCEN